MAREDPAAAKVVELRQFAGLGHEEVAAVLGITTYLARKKWTYARAWLHDPTRRLTAPGPSVVDRAGSGEPTEDPMATDLSRVQSLFLKVVESSDPAGYAAALDRVCAGDAELRRRVEGLLEAHHRPAELLDWPIVGRDGRSRVALRVGPR